MRHRLLSVSKLAGIDEFLLTKILWLVVIG